MRLGYEATAVDINPVAWFILKCTLEYPQKLAGQTRSLPEFILHNDAFMADFFAKAKKYSKAEVKAALKRLHERLKKTVTWNQKADQQHFDFDRDGRGPADELQADLAWHVRAWGQWVLDRARRELAPYYPTYADFEPIKKDEVAYEPQPVRLVPLKEDGTPDIDALNAEFTDEYLEDKRNPRWVAKPTVASSVWLVCKKRPAASRPGWDNRVLAEKRAYIALKLREFWDAGIRGPDFVWAATGPAMEAYSKHPVVRKADEPNATMSVGEFLTHVRWMVVDYIVGRVLTGERGADLSAADRLDEVTAYYLLHRHDFGMDEAPVNALIMSITRVQRVEMPCSQAV